MFEGTPTKSADASAPSASSIQKLTLDDGYVLGAPLKQWSETAKNITFVVTHECNLRCKYCYLTKEPGKTMPLDLAKRVVDYILLNRTVFPERDVIWDFVGGEPFIEAELIDQIMGYIKLRMFELNHPWFNNYRFNNYRFSFATNGLLYDTEPVQRMIRENMEHISIGISVDARRVRLRIPNSLVFI